MRQFGLEAVVVAILAARALAEAGPLPEAARRLCGIWFALGWPAFTALIAVFWLMVTKSPPGI